MIRVIALKKSETKINTIIFVLGQKYYIADIFYVF